MVVQLVARRPDHPYEQKASIGEGRKFSVLLRPTRGANEVFRSYEDITHIVGVTHLKSQPAVGGDPLHAHVARKSVSRFRLNRDVLEYVTIIEVAGPVEGDSKCTRTLKRPDGVVELDLRVTLQTDDGALIAMTYAPSEGEEIVLAQANSQRYGAYVHVFEALEPGTLAVLLSEHV